MNEETIKAITHVVTRLDRHRYNFSVEETMYYIEVIPKGYYRVELQQGWWDCGKFQAFCMPCSHVIATCSSVLQDVSLYLSDVYKVVNVFCVLTYISRGYNMAYQKYEKEEKGSA